MGEEKGRSFGGREEGNYGAVEFFFGCSISYIIAKNRTFVWNFRQCHNENIELFSVPLVCDDSPFAKSAQPTIYPPPGHMMESPKQFLAVCRFLLLLVCVGVAKNIKNWEGEQQLAWFICFVPFFLFFEMGSCCSQCAKLFSLKKHGEYETIPNPAIPTDDGYDNTRLAYQLPDGKRPQTVSKVHLRIVPGIQILSSPIADNRSSTENTDHEQPTTVISKGWIFC